MGRVQGVQVVVKYEFSRAGNSRAVEQITMRPAAIHSQWMSTTGPEVLCSSVAMQQPDGFTDEGSVYGLGRHLTLSLISLFFFLGVAASARGPGISSGWRYLSLLQRNDQEHGGEKAARLWRDIRYLTILNDLAILSPTLSRNITVGLGGAPGASKMILLGA